MVAPVPAGFRRRDSAPAPLTLQVAEGDPLYLTLTPAAIAGAARALADAWRVLGVRRGDTVLIYDYGTSPLVLFASWCFVPRLERGAADLLGAVPICNDGLPEFASRALHVLRYLRPRVTIIDAAHMPVFLRRVAEEGAEVAAWTELIAVSPDEETVAPAEMAAWSRALGVPVRLLLRSGPALFFAAECEQGLLHASPRRYRLQVDGHPGGEPRSSGEGTLRVTNRFLDSPPAGRALAGLHAAIASGPCPCGRPGITFRCLP